MKKKTQGVKCRRIAGQSLIELALLMPPMLILVFGVIDYARAIQFNNILVSMSQEGANLAARTSASFQGIIKGLNATADPLTMGTNGMVYITKIMGTTVAGKVVARVEGQTRGVADIGSESLYSTLSSQVWACSSWDGSGNCTANLSNATAILPITLSDGEEIYAVETLYNYKVMFNYVMTTGPKL